MNIDTYNENLYESLRNTMNNSNNMYYMHDEEKEKQMINEIKAYQKACQELYLQSIISPESHLAKIPSRMPVESALGSLKYNFSITPNANGFFCLVIDPYYYKGQLFQSADVDGLGNGAASVTEIEFPQDDSIIDQYRLVSSCVILKYYGSFNEMSGIFVAATSSNVKNQNYTTFLTFDNIENINNKQVLKCVDGCKLIYSPIDEAATEFRATSLYDNGTDFNRYQYLFIVCGYSFQNTTSIRVDFFRNIEYTVTPQYREYITQTKDLPSEFIVPQIEQEVMPAPTTFHGNSIKNNKSWLLQVRDFATKFFSGVATAAGSALLNKYNPLNYLTPFGKFNLY
jgi:hypothetical protein